MNGHPQNSTAVRVGTVGAYLGRADLETVREVRRVVGRVTLSGKTGRTLINAMAKAGDLTGIDYDPAAYLPSRGPEADLFTDIEAFDPVISWQRDHGLRTIRSPGRFVRSGDQAALKAAFAEPLDPDVVRVVSLDSSWFRADRLPVLVDEASACAHRLALVLAGVMDPLSSPALVKGWRTFSRAMRDGGLVVEWLRADAVGIGFAADGGAFSAIGLTTSGRHHGMPLPKNQRDAYAERQRYPQVFVAGLLSWQRGSRLGALTDFGGAGLTDCPCDPCAGRSLLRFDRQWPKEVPEEVCKDAAAHDVAAWSDVARRVFASQDPTEAWALECRNAVQGADYVASTFKVSLRVPPSIIAWV
jgi:hypothetical protein